MHSLVWGLGHGMGHGVKYGGGTQHRTHGTGHAVGRNMTLEHGTGHRTWNMAGEHRDMGMTVERGMGHRARDMGHGMGHDHGGQHRVQSVPASSPQTSSHQPHWDSHPKPCGHQCHLEAGPALDLLEEGIARAVGGAEVATQDEVWLDTARGWSSSCIRARELGSSSVAKKSWEMPVLKPLVL